MPGGWNAERKGIMDSSSTISSPLARLHSLATELAIPIDPWLGLIIVLISIVGVAFFSSSEAALISVSSVRIRYLAEQGNRAAQTVEKLTRQHSKLFATILLTENALIIFASSIATVIAVSWLGSANTATATLLATLFDVTFVVIFGEITPKTLAAQHAERWALVVARPISLWLRVITPVIWAFTRVTDGMIRLFGGDSHNQSPFVTEEEIRMLINISSSEGRMKQAEGHLLQNVFKFGDRQAREVMTPRTSIDSVEADATVREFLTEFAEHGHSRWPVVREDLDDVVGILYVKDVLLALANPGKPILGLNIKPSAPDSGDIEQQRQAILDAQVVSLMRNAHFTPETKPVRDLLAEMRDRKVQVAILVDEFGGTAGMVTIEDMLEEIVGELQDELDEEGSHYVAVNETTMLADGQMRVEEVNHAFNTAIPEGDDYETLAGFVLQKLAHLPRKGEYTDYGNLRIEVDDVEGTKIKKLKLTKL